MTCPADGLYVLASLDGAPLRPRDAAALGLVAESGQDRIRIAVGDRGIAGAVTTDHAFLGHIDEQAALAASLGLPEATAPAALVRAALERFGDDAPSRILGEWSFLQWNRQSGAVTLMVSDTLRDPLLFATDGRRVAIAPHIRSLRRLDWVDPVPDTAKLLLYLGRAPLRGSIGDATILRDVRRVTAGTRVTIDRSGVTTSTRRPLPQPTRWRGSFAEAIEELDAVLRRILHAQMARNPDSAVLLSGGLDSSLVAVFAAAERQAGGTLVALTSAAPAGSGLLDEVEFSQAVAAQAGIAMLKVTPDADVDAYRLSAQTLDWAQHPLLSPRHYVYDALYGAAVEQRACAVFDACEGEWTLTGYPDGLGWRQRLRDSLSRMTARSAPRTTQDAFHVRLSRPALATAERDLQAALGTPAPAAIPHRRDTLWGYSPAIVQSLSETTTTAVPGLRRLMPLRDRRLLTLFAGMPYAFMTKGGVMRAPGRALLAGKVPEHVRLRKHGRPFSPDYTVRLRRQAFAARSRLAGYERAGAGEWIDLPWLDAALQRIGGTQQVPLDLVFAAQLTSNAAVFLSHWLQGGTDDDVGR